MKSNSWMNAVLCLLLGVLLIPGNTHSANLIRWYDSTGSCRENGSRYQAVLEREGDLSSELSVRIETRNGSATAGSDFVALNQAAVFLAGEASIPVTVAIINDGFREPNERFQLVIAAPPAGWRIQGSSVHSVVIEDNDPGFAMGFGGEANPFEISVSESGGMVRIPVQRGSDSVEEAWVEYEITPDAALEGQDCLGTQGRLVFGSSDQEKWIEIPIVQDTVAETSVEFFSARIVRSSLGTVIGKVLESRVTIFDDDFGPAPELVRSNGRALESSDGFQVRVHRGQNPPVGRVEVGYRTVSGSAIGREDFVPLEGLLSFEPGELTKSIDISLLQDTLRESDESFSFELFHIEGSPAPAPGSNLSLVIEDDDQGFRIDPSSLMSWQREEGEPVVIRVLRADDRLQPMSVGFRTVQGTATAGEDFVPVQGRLSFGPTERVQPIIIPLIDDRIREDQENFNVELFDPEGGSLGELASATISIAPNDEPPDFYFGPRAIESEAMGQVFVSLLEPAEHELRYRVVVEAFDGLGGAIPGSDPKTADFQPIDRVVIIPAGRKQAIAQFPVSTQNRDRTAAQRKLVARVEPLDGSGGWTHDPVEFEIADEANEFELIPPFDLPLYSGIPEGAGTVEYRLRRHGGTLQPAVVAYEIRGIDSADAARPDVDFVASQGTLRFESGEVEKRIPVTVIDGIDKASSYGLFFVLGLKLIEGEGSFGSIQSAGLPRRADKVLQIVDNDSEPWTAFQSPFFLESPFGNQLVEMEGKAEFVLKRQGNLESPFICLVEVQPFDSFSGFEYDYGYRPATPGLDFEVSTVRLEYAAGQSEATFSVGLHADMEVESTEVLDLNFTWIESSGASNRVRQIMNLLDATSLPMRVQPLTREELRTIDLSVDERAFPDGSRLYSEPMAGFGQQTAVFRADRSGAGVFGFEPLLHNRGVGRQVGNAPHRDVTLAAQGDRFWMMYPTLELVPTFRLQRFSATGQPDANIGPMQLTTLATFEYSQLWKSELWSPLRLIPEGSNSMALLGSTRWVNGRLTPYGARIISIPQELDVASQSATVSEADGARSVVILRFGDIRQPASYRWRITDGTAKSDRDYVPGNGLLEFGPGQSLARIPLVLIDNATADWDRALVVRFERADSGRLAAEVDIVVANDDPGILDISPAQEDPTKIRLVVTGPLKPRSYERDVNILASNDLVYWTPISPDLSPLIGFYPDDPGWQVPMEHHLQYFKVHAVRR